MNKKVKSLYVHIPFCRNICDYCDFTKLQYFYFLADDYLSSLEQELKNLKIKDQLETIYIGGGTPTVLDNDLLERLFLMLKPYSQNVLEYTIETNPETLDIEKVKLLKKYHINRVSIGVESTDDIILKAINRHHTFNNVVEAIKLLKNEDIYNINIDLILGLPNVSKNMLLKDLDNVLSLDVNHISCYSLSVHPNTVFYLNGIKENDTDYERELYDLVHQKLTEHGYIHYEISNFAKIGYESRHNFAYWNNDFYYGIGLGASGYIDNIRYTNGKNLNKYNKKIYEKETETLSNDDRLFYQIMLNLRTNKGLNLKYLKSEFDYDLLTIKPKEIDNLIARELIYIYNDQLIATYEGMMILDRIINLLTK